MLDISDGFWTLCNFFRLLVFSRVNRWSCRYIFSVVGCVSFIISVTFDVTWLYICCVQNWK